MTDSHDPRASSDAAAHSPTASPTLPKRAWGAPFLALNSWWTRFEIALATLAFSLEVISMSMWVCLKGISSPVEYVGGLVFRSFLGAALLGTASTTWGAISLWPNGSRGGAR